MHVNEARSRHAKMVRVPASLAAACAGLHKYKKLGEVAEEFWHKWHPDSFARSSEAAGVRPVRAVADEVLRTARAERAEAVARAERAEAERAEAVARAERAEAERAAAEERAERAETVRPARPARSRSAGDGKARARAAIAARREWAAAHPGQKPRARSEDPIEKAAANRTAYLKTRVWGPAHEEHAEMFEFFRAEYGAYRAKKTAAIAA